MKVAIFINTPAQVHFWKNIIIGLQKQGIDNVLLLRERGETITLSSELGIKGYIYSKTPGKGFSKILSFPSDILRASIFLRNYKPDLIMDFGIYGVLTGKILNKPSIVFTDSEPSIKNIYRLQYKIFMPFVDLVITPIFFRDDLGSKHIRIDSVKELAYLSPEFYKPNSDIINLIGLNIGDRYVVLRFNDLAGVHDIGLHGFSLRKKQELIHLLENVGVKVFVSFEGDVPSSLKKYQLNIPKNRIHDLIYYAELLITDTQTMATEAAVLGTPVVRCNTFVGLNDMGNFKELENKYDLMYNFYDAEKAIKKSMELIKNQNLKYVWKLKREIFLKDKINISEYMIKLISNYKRN